MERERGCLDDDSIVRFQTGRLDRAALSSVERHVDACATCALLIMPSGSLSATRRLQGAHALTAGDLVGGRYRIERLLGGGGMGEVYSAFDEQLGERVALKTVRATIADDARAIARLKSEVQLARRVTHPNVCRIYDLGIHAAASEPGKPLAFLTMELLPGRTLADEIRSRGPFPEETAERILRQLVAGLAAAHRAGVIHKDFKSDNVILVTADRSTKGATEEARVVITDFGLAATEELAIASDDNRLEFSGTPGYIAPERLRGAAATAASDVYSLGIVLHDMLEGRVPAGPPPPEDASLSSSAGLRALVSRCCDASPQARPTVAALAGLASRPEPRSRRRSLRAVSLAGAAALLATTIGLSLRSRTAVPANPAAAVAQPAIARPPEPEPTPVAPEPPATSRPEPAARPARRVAVGRRHDEPAGPLAAALNAEPPPPATPAPAPERERPDEPIRTLGPIPGKTGPMTLGAGDDAVIDPFANRR